jgi:hypothetical protein
MGSIVNVGIDNYKGRTNMHILKRNNNGDEVGGAYLTATLVILGFSFAGSVLVSDVSA